MGRFILRFRGGGFRLPEDIARIRSERNIRILDDSSSRMVLVEGALEDLKALIEVMPGWVMSEEQIIPLPDPRPKVRSSGT